MVYVWIVVLGVIAVIFKHYIEPKLQANKGSSKGLKRVNYGDNVCDDYDLFCQPLTPRKFFTAREGAFYKHLVDIIGGRSVLVFSKVKLIDIVDIPKTLAKSERRTQKNYIKELHIDFVLVEPGTYRVLAAIEVDDSSHRSSKAQYRDDKKNQALESAGVPLVRIPQGYFTKESIGNAVFQYIK